MIVWSLECRVVSAKAPRCRFPLNPISQIKVVNPRNLKYFWSLVIVAFPFRISLIITYNITTYQHVSVISRGIHSRSLDFLGRVAAEFVLATAALEALRRLQKKMEWGREVEYAKMVVSWFMVSMFSLQERFLSDKIYWIHRIHQNRHQCLCSSLRVARYCELLRLQSSPSLLLLHICSHH